MYQVSSQRTTIIMNMKGKGVIVMPMFDKFSEELFADMVGATSESRHEIDQKKQQMQQKNAEEAAIKQQKASKQITSGLANGVSSSVQMGMRRMPMQPTGGYDNGMDGPEY